MCQKIFNIYYFDTFQREGYENESQKHSNDKIHFIQRQCLAVPSIIGYSSIANQIQLTITPLLQFVEVDASDPRLLSRNYCIHMT